MSGHTEAPVTAWMRRARVALIGVGVALLVLGGVVLINDVNPARYVGIAAWMLGSLVIHDGIIAFVVVGVSIALRRLGRSIPFVVLAIVQGALVVAAIVTGLVVPQMLKQAIGSENESILPLDYGLHLGLFYAGLAVVTAAAIGVALVLRRGVSAGRGR